MLLEEICIAALLSQRSSISKSTCAPRSCINPYSQTRSAIVVTMLLYSAPADLLDTVLYFFDFHETKDSLNLISKLVTDFLDNKHDAQSESQKNTNIS